MGSMAEALSEMYDRKIRFENGQFYVGETTMHYIIVHEMIFSWRISRSPKDDYLGDDRNWCYYGKGLMNFLLTIEAAVNWDGADDTEPEGWDKNANTGVYANPGKFQNSESPISFQVSMGEENAR